MKKLMFFLTLILGSFSLTSATLPVHVEPINIESVDTVVAAHSSEDLSEFCKPDWSGYDTLSPDISTRRFLYPDKTKPAQ